MKKKECRTVKRSNCTDFLFNNSNVRLDDKRYSQVLIYTYDYTASTAVIHSIYLQNVFRKLHTLLYRELNKILNIKCVEIRDNTILTVWWVSYV